MNLKRFLAVGRVLLLLVIGVALQTLVVSRISVLGVSADLFVILTVVVAIGWGSMHGAIFGFCAGLTADVAFMETLGARSLVYVLAGYFVGMLAYRFGSVNPWGVLLLAGGASLFAQFLYGLFQYMIGPRGGFLTMLVTQILPQTVLDALVTVPVYVLLVHLRVVPVAHFEPRGAAE